MAKLLRAGSDADKLVESRVAGELENLTLQARIVADTILHGLHRSSHHGSSVEFSDHKEYAPGDDVRHLDWRAFARLDRDYIKRFENESLLSVMLLVDASASMGYQSRSASRPTKLDFAKLCAASIAYVAARQGDAVGLCSFREEPVLLAPPRARRGHLHEILLGLSQIVADGPTRVAKAVDALLDGISRRAIVFVFSDLLDAGFGAIEAICKLAARRHDVACIQVLDRDEIELPFSDRALFFSPEDGRELAVDVRSIKSAYKAELHAFLSRIERTFGVARVEYHRITTDGDPASFLLSMLRRRAQTRAHVR